MMGLRIMTGTGFFQYDADICRTNRWGPGTQLVGDEGYGPTVIEITAVGERALLAVTISHNGVPEPVRRESNWTLMCRDWKVLTPTRAEAGAGEREAE
jgi:hypothetical protein